MARISVTVWKLDQILRAFDAHERVVDWRASDDCAHRHGAVGQGLRDAEDVRSHAERIGAESIPSAAEARNHLIEDQQYVVRRANVAQARKVTAWRHEDAGGARERLDDDGGDVLRAVSCDERLERIGELSATLRLTPRERVLFK